MKIVCSTTSYKTFLLCCNVALLFVGLSVFFLGLKMQWAISLLLLDVPMALKAVKAVIATGFFISVSGVSGISGTCLENVWLMFMHLISLGVIVVMEFSLGVTLMIVKKTIENAMENANCNHMCAAAVDAIVLDYALPSAWLMMSIIFIEALMIYSSIKLYFHYRDFPKTRSTPERGSTAVQTVPMQTVATQPTTYGYGHHTMFAPQLVYMTPPPEPGYVTSPFVRHRLEAPDVDLEMKPPDYDSLNFHQQTLYLRRNSASNLREDSLPKELARSFNPV